VKQNYDDIPPHRRWAEFRFSVVGRLLSSPPKKGDLRMELEKLSKKIWRHPLSGESVQFGLSTIERWFYQAKNERMYPVDALKSKIRSDQGKFKAIDQEIGDYLKNQYMNHKSWSYKLHADNIKAVTNGSAPSYSSILRYMKRNGLYKQKRLRKKFLIGNEETAFLPKESRSFENEYTNGLWHSDFHHCSQQVINKEGKWVTPVVVAILDDHSRLACHVQWYLAETAKNLVHAFSQAVLKRGVPRAFLSDNGSAFVSKEFTSGLKRLGMEINNTMPYHPAQNGKQERFWGSLEKRLMDMIENKKELTLKELNEYTTIWVEMEYNRSNHDEIKCPPIDRFSKDQDVGRSAPSLEELKILFCREEKRRQRRMDGSISLAGERYEIPSRYRTIESIWVRYAEWDLSFVHMVDILSGKILCRIYPVDKFKNANQGRRIIDDGKNAEVTTSNSSSSEIAPLLQKYKEEYLSRGIPFSYIPQDENL